jgi:hypothetical protein
LRDTGVDHADDRYRRRLRARRERPCDRRAAEERDELAPLHSITSSARTSRERGHELGRFTHLDDADLQAQET